MAKSNPKPRPAITERFGTVSSAVGRGKQNPGWQDPQGSQIRLNGHWVREAGFPKSMKIRVQIEQGRLVITPAQ